MYKRILLGAIASSLLVGCGGGSSDNVNDSTLPQPVSVTAPIPGFYAGTNRPEGSADEVEVDMMIATDGSMRGISQSLFMLSSNLTLNERSLSSDKLINFEPQSRGDGVFFGNAIQEGSISGTKTGNAIEGSAFFGNNQSTFNFQSKSIQASGDLGAISGSYVDQTSSVEMTIDSDGVLSGVDSFGCLYSGSFSASDPDLSVLQASITVENCGDYTADYQGLVTFAPANTFDNQEQDWLIIAADNTELSMVAYMLRN